MKILLKELPGDEGKFEWSETTTVSYFSQDYRTLLDPEQTVLQWMEDNAVASSQEIRSILGQVLFRGSDVDKKIALLSGGESARLVMGKIILEKPNVLILDEPTNHLDLESIDALIEALQAFAGTVLFVSHNRHFIDNISTRVLVLTEQHGAQNYLGNYQEYLDQFGTDYLGTA